MKKIQCFRNSLAVFAFSMTLMIASTSQAGDTYLYKGKNKIDIIKLTGAKKEEKGDGLAQPKTFDTEQMRSILRSLRFNKKDLVFKDKENARLFQENDIDFLTPYLVEAFQKATDDQVVSVSYFTKDSKAMIQNDRLSIMRFFVKADGLHIRFNKLYAKMLGDRTTMGASRAVTEAHGANVSLEIQPGQERIGFDPDEILVKLDGPIGNHNAVVTKEVKSSKAKKATVVTTEEVSSTPVAKTSTKTSTSPADNSIRSRLKELDQLKKDELITEKEYQQKKKELLNQL